MDFPGKSTLTLAFKTQRCVREVAFQTQMFSDPFVALAVSPYSRRMTAPCARACSNSPFPQHRLADGLQQEPRTRGAERGGPLEDFDVVPVGGPDGASNKGKFKR